jgi:hypothetical protein
MISFRVSVSLYFLICGFLLGFFMAFIFMPGKPNDSSVKSLPVTTKQLDKQVSTIEKAYQNSIVLLQNKNSELQQKLATTQSSLEQAKQSVRQKERTVKKFAQTGNSIKKKLSFENYTIPLFEQSSCDCDSLKIEVAEYINENLRKDSLYEMQLSTMDSVISVKDSIVHSTEGLYNSLHQIYDKTIIAQQVLQNENHVLKKREERRKVKNKVLTAGLMILSGAVANFLLHH